MTQLFNEVARAVPCQCRHVACRHWHIEPYAQVQGVQFTEAEATLLAAVINGFREARLTGADPAPLPKLPLRRVGAPS